jgi:hypothetical protein
MCGREALAGLLLTTALPGLASAQSAIGGTGPLFRADVAGARAEPGLTPKPIRLGAWLADINATTEARYESNILNSRVDKLYDMSFAFEPSAALRSNWRRHAVAFRADATLRHYVTERRQDTDTYDLGIDGRLDLPRDGEATGGLAYSRVAEERGSGGATNGGAGPVLTRVWDVHTAGKAQLGRFALDGRWSLSERHYEDLRDADGAVVDQSFRDVRIGSGAGRIGYRVDRRVSPFVAADLSSTTSIFPLEGRRRDALNYGALVGVDLRDIGLFSARLAAGWRRRDYENRRYKDYDGPTWDATLDWYPRRLVSMRFESTQDFRNSNLRDVAGILVRTGTITTYYDMLRKLRLKLVTGYERDRYREIGVRTDAVGVTLAGDYTLGPRIAAHAYVRYKRRWSTDPRKVGVYSGMTAGFSVTGWL